MSMRSKPDLDVLTAVESGETVSQHMLSRRVGVAVGLLNSVLKRAVRKGFVKIKSAPARRYAYYLTPQGFAEKSRLVAEYVEVSLDFFRQARSQYSQLIERAGSVGFKRIAIVGQGELVEIAVLAALEHGVKLAGVVSAQTETKQVFGLVVVTDLEHLADIDAVILADTANAQGSYDRCVARLGVDRVLAPALLRISAGRPAEIDAKPNVTSALAQQQQSGSGLGGDRR